MVRFTDAYPESRYLADLRERCVDTSFYEMLKRWNVNPMEVGWIHSGPWIAEEVERFFTQLKEKGWDGKVAQIKVKFGEVRIYLENPLKEVEEEYRVLLERTNSLCWVCGEPSVGAPSYHTCEKHKELRVT